jgi:hypothetical protein
VVTKLWCDVCRTLIRDMGDGHVRTKASRMGHDNTNEGVIFLNLTTFAASLSQPLSTYLFISEIALEMVE